MFDRQVLQTKRDNLTKESNEFKSDYGKYMASMSKKVTEGKVEHARLTNYVSNRYIANAFRPKSGMQMLIG